MRSCSVMRIMISVTAKSLCLPAIIAVTASTGFAAGFVKAASVAVRFAFGSSNSASVAVRFCDVADADIESLRKRRFSQRQKRGARSVFSRRATKQRMFAPQPPVFLQPPATPPVSVSDPNNPPNAPRRRGLDDSARRRVALRFDPDSAMLSAILEETSDGSASGDGGAGEDLPAARANVHRRLDFGEEYAHPSAAKAALCGWCVRPQPEYRCSVCAITTCSDCVAKTALCDQCHKPSRCVDCSKENAEGASCVCTKCRNRQTDSIVHPGHDRNRSAMQATSVAYQARLLAAAFNYPLPDAPAADFGGAEMTEDDQ